MLVHEDKINGEKVNEFRERRLALISAHNSRMKLVPKKTFDLHKTIRNIKAKKANDVINARRTKNFTI
jgi:hypothetical protein